MTEYILIGLGVLFTVGGIVYLVRAGKADEPELEQEEDALPVNAVSKPRSRKGIRKKKLQQSKEPSLRVVPRNEERNDDIPEHLAWYFRKDTRPAGPYTLEEMLRFVKSGRINDETLVWTNELTDDWVPAREVDALHAPQVIAG